MSGEDLGVDGAACAAPRGACTVCGVDTGNKACSRCLAVRYCSSEHQAQHWPQHRQDCSPGYRQIDGHLVATRDIKQGAIIFKEQPIIVYPSRSGTTVEWEKRVFSCGHCCRVLDSGAPAAWATCRCGLPLCAPRCALDSPGHHTAAECKLMEEHGVRESVNDSWVLSSFRCERGVLKATVLLGLLAPLRCLMLSGRKLQALQALASLEERVRAFQRESRGAGSPLAPSQVLCGVKEFQGVVQNPVQLIGRLFGRRFSAEDVVRVVGRFHAMTFSYEDDVRGLSGHALYEKASLLPHSCLPNTRFAAFGEEEGDFTGAVLATEDIPAGAVLTLRYGDTLSLLKHTAARRLDMARRLVVCRCARCQDPAELGLSLGSTCCKRCRDAGMPMSLLLPSGTSPRPTWRCGACGSVETHEDVQQVIKLLSKEVEFKSRRLGSLEELLERLVYPAAPLHPTSTVVLTAQHYLMEMYAERYDGNVPSPSALTEEDRTGMLRVCRGLLSAMDILAPQLTDERGRVLRYLVVALTEKGRREARNPASREEARALLAEAEKHFLESKRIFIEPGCQRILTKLKEGVEELKTLLAVCP